MIRIKPNYAPYIVAVIYFLISIIVLGSFIDLLDVDYYSYMAIARKYKMGEWYYAMNDYWSPLISWLMALGYLISNNEMLVIKVLKIIFGTISLFYTYQLLNLLSIRYKGIFIFIFSVLLFYYQFTPQTTDSLSLMMLIVFVYFNILNKSKLDRLFVLKYSLLTLFLYFSKYYTLYFVFLFTPVIYFYKNDFNIKGFFQTEKVLSLIKTYCLTLIFVLGWVTLNYTKTKQFTITSSSAYNLNIMNPKHHKVHPISYSDIRELPDKYSFSPLDYFPYKANMEPFSFFSSKKNLSFFFWYEKGQVRNFFEALYVEVIPLIILLIVGYFLKISVDRKSLLFILLFAMVFPVGYFLSFMLPRYLMITDYLLLLGIAMLLSSLLVDKKIIVSVPFLIIVSLFLVYNYTQGIIELKESNGGFKEFWEEGKKYTGNITNTNVAVYANGRTEKLWSYGISMSYLGNATFYGQINIKNYSSNAELTKKLMDYNINIYLTPKRVPICPDSATYKLMGAVQDSIEVFKRIN